MAERRAGWHEQLAAESVGALVFVDESGANTKMTRLRGRAWGGQRLLARVPHGHYQTTTLVAGLLFWALMATLDYLLARSLFPGYLAMKLSKE